ncbi:MAG: phosphatase PAP2-related protein [Candidatus Paceibacterota bacterium]|jgi:hypothetical protein
MKTLIEKYKILFGNREFVISTALGVLFLVVGFLSNHIAVLYSTMWVSNSVNDIVLDSIKTFDVDVIFVWGAYALVAFIFFLVIVQPKHFPFALKTISLFIVVRSLFTVLTHIGQPLNQLPVDPIRFGSSFFFGGDLFFSGHTGLPFLMMLLFWDEKWLRPIFFSVSIFFAVIVLLGHYHYSIDVFAAYFITYGIYKISLKLFKKDFHISQQ